MSDYQTKKLGRAIRIFTIRPDYKYESLEPKAVFSANSHAYLTVEKVEECLEWYRRYRPTNLVLIQNCVIQAGSYSPDQIQDIRTYLEAVYN